MSEILFSLADSYWAYRMFDSWKNMEVQQFS